MTFFMQTLLVGEIVRLVESEFTVGVLFQVAPLFCWIQEELNALHVPAKMLFCHLTCRGHNLYLLQIVYRRDIETCLAKVGVS